MGLLRGAADGERTAGRPPRPRPRLQGHLPPLPDHARLLRRAQGRLGLPRPAGRDRGRGEARLQEQGGHRALRNRRVQPAVPRVGVRVPRGLGRADRADRLLGRPRARPTARSTRPTSSPCGGRCAPSGTGTCSTRATRSSPTARATGPRCPATRSPSATSDVVDPSVYVRFPTVDAGPPLEPGDVLLVWTTTPWTLVSNAAVAVDPDLLYVRARKGGEVYVVAEALMERVLGEDAELLDRFAGRELEGTRYFPPFPFLGAAGYGERGHTVLLGRLRHRRRRHRPRPHRDRLRRGRLPPRRAVRPPRGQPRAARRDLRRAHRPLRRPVRQGRRSRPHRRPARARASSSARRSTSTPTRTAGAAARRSSTTPSPPGTSPRAGCATACSRPTRRSTGIPEHIKHGRFGKWLENNVDWALSRERYWGTPLPVWRCEADPEHVHCIGSFAELRGALGRRARGPAPALRRRRHLPLRRTATGTMRRVPEVIDVWFDSGAMPFAQHHAPFENEEHFEAHFPADFICEALDQTRGWFYSLLADLDADLRPRAVRERRLPRPDPRRRGQEDEQVARATSSCPGT